MKSKDRMTQAELNVILRHLNPLQLMAENNYTRYKCLVKRGGDETTVKSMIYYQNYASAMRHAIATAKQKAGKATNG